MVSRVYRNLDNIISTEIAKGKKIAIFPMGRVGTLARYILENKYACIGIYIDNNQCSSDTNIISLEKYKDLDEKGISMLLATNMIPLNKALLQELQCAAIKAEIINIVDYYDNCLEKRMEKIRNLCRVKRVKGYELIRVGPMHDGGYVMLNDFESRSIAYSIGIASEVGWDLDMAQRGFHVYCFDHTIRKLPIENSNLHFMQLGLGGINKITENLYTLDTMLDLNNHNYRKKMILKIDIEGAEWEFLQEISSDILNCFSQITMELHHLLNEDYHEKIIAGLKKLNKTHQTVWIHANCIGGVQKYGAITMPDLLEITFVNKKEYEFVPIIYDCPIDLDCPNSLGEDVVLKGWGTLEKLSERSLS